MKTLFFFWVLCLGLGATTAWAQVVRGIVVGDEGALGFVSIRVQGSPLGTVSNLEGKYELKLAPGTYQLFFQSLGYKTEERTIVLASEDQRLDVTLKPQAILQKEVVVGNREDPARSIMRRAIAKAPVERMKVRAYTAKVYMKGGGKLTKIPWLVEGKLKDEGITENTVYFSETLSEITYRAPNFYKNRAISVRSNMEKLGGNASPNQFIQSSFYYPQVGNAVSPLAPNAFSHYTFTYEGIFTDRGVEVNKIRVKPRQRGDDVFDGYIYILEGEWCIHSLNLTTEHEGFKVTINQIYTPVQNIWMPATQKYVFVGNVLGFGFEGSYLASMRDYSLTVDPNLTKPLEIIDEKKEPDETKALRKVESTKTGDELRLALSDTTKRVSRKALRKAMRAALRQERKASEEKYKGKNVAQEDSTVVDSLAYKRDSTYWETNRLIPLTELEVKSTVKLDSIAIVKRVENRRDSIKQAVKNGTGTSGKGINQVLNSILYGHTFFLTRQDTSVAGRNRPRLHRVKLGGIMNGDANFNTVEGYVLSAKLQYQYYRPGTQERPFRDFTLGPKVRYAFARQQVLPIIQSAYYYARGNIKAELGRNVSQINPEGGISPYINGSATLFFERNYMRLFLKDYVRVDHETFFADRVQVNSYAELAERTTMANSVKRPFINWNSRTFSPNIDDNVFAGSTAFVKHRAALLGSHIIYTPTVRYVIKNGERIYTPDGEPYFHLKVNAGIPQLRQSTSNFLNSAVGAEQSLKLGIHGRLIYYLEAGAFLLNQKSYVPDFFHFEGNRTFLIVGDGLKAFRNLPYYRYSTPVRYAQQHIVFIPRQFILSRFTLLRYMGWKESFGYHGLTVPGQPQYSEITYGIDGIFRFVRIEGVAIFQNQVYQQAAFRIGVTLKQFSPKLRRKTTQGDPEGSIRIHL